MYRGWGPTRIGARTSQGASRWEAGPGVPSPLLAGIGSGKDAAEPEGSEKQHWRRC